MKYIISNKFKRNLKVNYLMNLKFFTASITEQVNFL